MAAVMHVIQHILVNWIHAEKRLRDLGDLMARRFFSFCAQAFVPQLAAEGVEKEPSDPSMLQPLPLVEGWVRMI